jgi:hypothetical protein
MKRTRKPLVDVLDLPEDVLARGQRAQQAACHPLRDPPPLELTEEGARPEGTRFRTALRRLGRRLSLTQTQPAVPVKFLPVVEDDLVGLAVRGPIDDPARKVAVGLQLVEGGTELLLCPGEVLIPMDAQDFAKFVVALFEGAVLS